MIAKIADSVPAGADDWVVEIGPGDGALTEQLAARYKRFLAIEIDPVMVQHLNESLPDVKVLHQDILAFDWGEVGEQDEPVHVVGNLPYYITSQILFALLAERRRLKTATLMMQKEVARRIVAEHGNREYGILSVQTQLMSTPSILFDVPPGVFSPPPKVDSSVLQLQFDQGALPCSDEHLKTVVRTAFNQRRKKLSNALKPVTDSLPADIVDASLRPEALTPAMYASLTARLEQLGTFGEQE